MAIVIRWYGNACFVVEGAGTSIAIDPWITGNPGCPIGVDEFPPVEAVLVTHGHPGHYGNGDALVIARDNDAPFIAPRALIEYVRSSVPVSVTCKLRAVDAGDVVRVGAITAKVVSVPHPPVRPHVGSAGPPGDPNVGFRVLVEGMHLLHMGDARSDPELLSALAADCEPTDVALMPLWCEEMGWSEADAVSSVRDIIAVLQPALVIPHARYSPANGSAALLRKALGSSQSSILDLAPGDRVVVIGDPGRDHYQA